MKAVTAAWRAMLLLTCGKGRYFCPLVVSLSNHENALRQAQGERYRIPIVNLCLAFLLAFSFLAIDVAPAYASKAGKLEPGDILFAASWVKSEDGEEGLPGSFFLWDHVAIYIGEGKVVESVSDGLGNPLPGTRVVAWKEFRKRWGTVRTMRLVDGPFVKQWRRRSYEVAREQVIQAAIDYSLRQAELQTPYDWKGNKYDGSAFYCSELVWRAFRQAASIDLDYNEGYTVSPDDLYYSELLVPVNRQKSLPNPDMGQDTTPGRGDRPVAPTGESGK